MKRAISGLIGLGAGLAAFGIGLGYAGALHPVGDSVAAFRWELALILLALSGLLAKLGARRGAALGICVALVAALPILWQMRPQAGGGPISLYQKNVWIGNPDWEALLADIRDADPDLIAVEEVHRRHDPLIAALLATHPHRVACRGGVQILSRLPMIEGSARCAPESVLPAAIMQVEAPGGPLWVVSIHLHWPWPYAQADHAAAIADVLAGLDAPVVMAGDFNMPPWGHSVRRLARAADARRLGPLRPTHALRGFPARLVLDHVYVPEGWAGSVPRRPLIGSDHYGQFARFGP